MKTSKTMSKALMLALAVMLVFALAVPALAQNYFTTTSASYVQGTAPTYSNSTIHVNLVLESRKISGNNLYKTVSNVALTAGSTPKSFYVRDVLLAVQSDTNNNVSFNDYDGNPIDSSKDYVYSITDKSSNPYRTYAPTSRYAWNGWMFRINGQFPLEKSSPVTGASIATAYVTDGDTIHFYHDDMDEAGDGAYYAKITSVNKSGNNLTVNVKASFQYDQSQSPYNWIIDDFTNYQGAQVQVRDANGNLIDSGYTDASGNVTLNVTGKTGTCTVEVVRSFLETIDYQNGLIDNTADKVSFTL
ncbi:MAG: hypothetical protein BWY65_01502 [Firmicutes bacterium ADurb.Bin373]|nr:MAG: hypothetical protein BWY65_01502 [Firmicutes bacterium ADurb.Bin373]